MNLSKEEALAALRALYVTPEYHSDSVVYAGKYVKNTGIIPEWLNKMPDETDHWYVRHGGETYETTAASREDAINNIRFNLYGRTPAAQLPPFEAVNPAFIILDAIGSRRREIDRRMPRDLFNRRTLPKSEAIARLRRLTA